MPREALDGQSNSSLSDHGSHSHRHGEGRTEPCAAPVAAQAGVAEHAGGQHFWTTRRHSMALVSENLRGQAAKHRLLYRGLADALQATQRCSMALQERHKALQEHLRREQGQAGSVCSWPQAATGTGPSSAPWEEQGCPDGSADLTRLGGDSEEVGDGSNTDFCSGQEGEFERAVERLSEIDQVLACLLVSLKRSQGGPNLPLWALRIPPPQPVPATGVSFPSSSTGRPAVSPPSMHLVPAPEFSFALESGLWVAGSWPELLHL